MKQIDNFDGNLHYRLYSNIGKIIHPTISKNNISSYKVVLSEDVLPVRIFYPERVSKIEKIIIYIHGITSISSCNNYASFCSGIAVKTKSLVIALDYDENDSYLNCLDSCFKTYNFLNEELIKTGISSSNIALMGDSIGANMVLGINRLSKEVINKSIVVSPIIGKDVLDDTTMSKNERYNLELISKVQQYYKKNVSSKDINNYLIFPELNKEKFKSDILFIVGEMDIFREKALEYCNTVEGKSLVLELANHNFFKNMDFSIDKLFYDNLYSFL